MTKQYFTKDEVATLVCRCEYGKTITSKKLRKFAIESQLDALHTLCEEAARIIMERALVMWSKEVEELQVRNQKLAEALGKFTKFQEEAAAADKAGGDEPVEFWNAVDGWVSVPAESADKPAAWVYPEFWEHLEKVGCGTAYRTEGDGRQPLFTRPQPKAVNHDVVAGALFDLMGHLTTRDERLILSSCDDAAPAVAAVSAFAKKRGLNLDNPAISDWTALLSGSTNRESKE